MSESKSFASLGPMLLARKGTAKPAMRLQIEQAPSVNTMIDDFDELANSQDALGWNDMGDSDDIGSNDDDVISLPVKGKASKAKRSKAKKPAKLTKSKATKAAKTAKAAAGQKARAAFTLRLDAERHLKLRLASTLQGCSAQALVTQALDSFLEDVPELEEIAARMRRMNNQS